jgi:hypothetical protein
MYRWRTVAPVLDLARARCLGSLSSRVTSAAGMMPSGTDRSPIIPASVSPDPCRCGLQAVGHPSRCRLRLMPDRSGCRLGGITWQVKWLYMSLRIGPQGGQQYALPRSAAAPPFQPRHDGTRPEPNFAHREADRGGGDCRAHAGDRCSRSVRFQGCVYRDVCS